MQWARDSAYRFFPLVDHPEFGLVLHPFDLATNKVLALAGRLEVRDWIDVIESSRRAAARLPGVGRARQGRRVFSQRDSRARLPIRPLLRRGDRGAVVSGRPPDAATLAQEWHRLVDQARELHRILPAREVGTCVLNADGGLFNGGPVALHSALDEGRVRFNSGSLRGALPSPVRPGP